MSHHPKERPVASTPDPGSEEIHPLRRALARGPSRAFLVGLFALALLVFLPAIRAPFLLDDYLHRAMANGVFPAPRGPLDFYDFVNAHDRATLLERGVLPWWTDPALEIRFFRPLSSLLLYADHTSFGAHPLLLHVHSFLWWMLAVLAVRSLFSRFFSPRITLLGTAIFALAPCHALPLAWLANREAIVSLAFGLSGLARYEDFRESRSRSAGALAGVLFALAFLAGEYALLLGGYVVALELFRGVGERGLARRCSGLLPFVVPAAVYLGVRHVLGYGTRASGFYFDPTREPIAYALGAPRRFLTLLAEGWLSLDGETIKGTTPVPLLLIVALVIALFVWGPVRAAIAALPERSARFGKAMLLGSFVSLLPVLSVVPSPRLLEAAIVGIAAAAALTIDHVLLAPPATAGPYPRGERAAAVAFAFAFFHLVHAPLTAWSQARGIQRAGVRFARHAQELAQRLEARPGAEVIVVRGTGGVGNAFFVPFALSRSGAPPTRWRILANTGHLLASREDERTLVLTVPKESNVFPSGHGNLFRTEAAPVPVGTIFEVQRMRAEVLDAGDRGPTRVRFTFEDSPSDALWVSETQEGFPEITPPDPGFGAPFDP